MTRGVAAAPRLLDDATKETRRRFLRDGLGVGPGLREGFFEPFFRGVFLSPLKEQDPRIFLLAFRALSAGRTSLPARGMQSVSDQLAEGLDARLGERVDEIRDDGAGVVLKVDGKALVFDRVVVATEGPAAARLLPGRAAPASRASTCLYFHPCGSFEGRRRRDCDVVDISRR